MHAARGALGSSRALALVLWTGCGACSGPSTVDEPPAPNADPCDAPGAICTWLGLPDGVVLLTPDEQDRRKTGLYLVQGSAFDPAGVGYVADFNNHRVLQVRLDGVAKVLTGTSMPGEGVDGSGSCVDGCPAHLTQVWHPADVAVDPANPSVVVGAMWHNHRLVRIDAAHDTITWIAGSGSEGYSDTSMAFPSAVVAGSQGDWYFSDQGNQVVRRLTADGKLELVAGTPKVGGYSGDGGPATAAKLHGHEDWVGGPTSKLARKGSTLYVADTMNGMVRAIDLDKGTIDRVVGKFVDGAISGSLPGYSGDDGPALDAVFANPRAVALGPGGEMYVTDTGNNCIRVVGTDGVVRRFAGKCGEEPALTGDGGPALEATMSFPCGIAVDAHGNVFVADSNNNVVRRIVPSAR